jgi:hypothetical protein
MADKAKLEPGTTDYDAIEAAVMETERGRWFLKEYARRNRNADSLVILQALDHIARALKAKTDQEAEAGATEAAPADRPRPPMPAPHPSVEHGAREPAEQSTRNLRQTASEIGEAVRRIEAIRDEIQHAGQAGGEPSSDSSSGSSVQDEALARIDDVIQVLHSLEMRISAAIVPSDQTPDDRRAREIARLKAQMMQEPISSVPYLM